MRWILRTVYKECRKWEAQVLSCLTWIRANSDTGSIMQCCGIIDVEGTQLSSEERFGKHCMGSIYLILKLSMRSCLRNSLHIPIMEDLLWIVCLSTFVGI